MGAAIMRIPSITRSLNTTASYWLRKIVSKLIGRSVRRHMVALEAATHQPQAAQEPLLRRILARHARTDFGREHHFGSMGTVADFRRQLPIADYDYFEPYIARVRRGDINALLADKHIHMF